jgi:outer membrane protein OmpA-like peptidoglycan-associated protein
VGYRFPVSKSLAITTEAVYHLLPDALNSIRNGVPGGNVQLLAGLHFSFGNKTKKAQTPKVVTPPDPPKRDYAAEARAAVEARAAAERAEAERRAAEEERLAAEQERLEAERARLEEEKERLKAAAQQTEEEKRAAEMAAEEYAAALSKAVAEAAGISDVKVYFESNSWSVQSKYEPELKKVATFLKENTDYSVILTAYSDSRYGTVEYNREISERRANAVARFLKKEGVEAAQILIRPAGGIDTYSKGENVKKNRFVVCEIVK